MRKLRKIGESNVTEGEDRILGKAMRSFVPNAGEKKERNRVRTQRIRFGHGKVLCDLDSSSLKRIGRTKARL